MMGDSEKTGQEAARRVLFTSPFVPPEWIAAQGLIPVRVVPDCGAPALPRAGICGFAASVEECLSTTRGADLIVLASTCDQMRRLAEPLMDRYADRVFLFNVPVTWEQESAMALYMEELRRLGRRMIRQGGTEPGPGFLVETMRCRLARREAVLGRRKRMTSLEFTEALMDLEGEFDGAAGGDASGKQNNGARLALVGGPLRRRDIGLFDLIESAGARVVLDATETGERCLPAPFDEVLLAEDPVLALVKAYWHGIPDVFQRPNTKLYDYLRKASSSCEAQGFILVRHLWCDLWHAELPRLREKLGLPIVEIDLGGGDGETARNRTRIESLVEILR